MADVVCRGLVVARLSGSVSAMFERAPPSLLQWFGLGWAIAIIAIYEYHYVEVGVSNSPHPASLYGFIAVIWTSHLAMLSVFAWFRSGGWVAFGTLALASYFAWGLQDWPLAIGLLGLVAGSLLAFFASLVGPVDTSRKSSAPDTPEEPEV